jgi:hypothetical protein
VTETAGRIALVGCVKKKREGTHPARDLYVSPLFAKRRAHVEAAGMPWFILSAEHGLVDPATRIAWYDRTLNTMSAEERRAWGERVLRQLREQVGDLRGITFELHAGARYVDAIAEGLRAAGATIKLPTAGLSLGRQLAWYGQDRGAVSR